MLASLLFLVYQLYELLCARHIFDVWNRFLIFCIFSSRGITKDGLITDSSIDESVIKKAMLKNAEKSYFLCDSSKIGKKFMYNIATIDDIEGVIYEIDS